MPEIAFMFTNRWMIEIEWGDCDAAGIVFYPQYFRYFDAASSRLFDAALQMSKKEWLRHYDVIGVPLVDAQANFKRPSTFGDVLVVESTVRQLSRSSITIAHRMLKNEVVTLEGSEKRVWAGRHPDDPKAIVAVPLPDEVRSALERVGG